MALLHSTLRELIRVNANRDIRKNIAQFALLQVDKPYDIFLGLHDSGSEYCSKLVWQVFFQNGIKLCQASPWILPDDIASSEKIEWIGIIIWILLVSLSLIRSLRKTKTSFLKVSILSFLSQSPGILMIFLSIYSYKTGVCEWEDGALELWIHPFLPFLELLPPKHIGKVSGVFINSCLLPFEIVIFFVVLLGGITIYYNRRTSDLENIK